MIRTMAGLTALLGALGAPAVAAAQADPPRTASFVVVVGTTRADRPGLATLRYADDDAARWYELTSEFADRVELLTVLDDETQQRHPGLAETARLPTRSALDAALERTRAAVASAKAQGLRTAFWFVFAGHGDVGENREGYLVLQDGRFTRTDLYEEVLARSNADVNHVVLDACRAWFMVSRRGSAPAAAIRELLDAQSLDRYPNTGVLVATTQSAEVHEWDRYRAGVFSHEVRSALRGGADVDGDGRIGYLEVAAFVTAANAKVTDPRGKLSIAALPPAANRAEALVDWERAESPRLLLEPRTDEAVWLEDDRGVRLADLHPAAGEAVTIHLPPGRTVVARGDGWETIVSPDPGSVVRLARLARTAPDMRSRGVAESFDRGLFALPYGASFYQGFIAANPRGLLPRAPPVPRRRWTWRTPAAWTAASGSLAAGALALAELDRARAATVKHREAFGSEERIASLRARAERGRRNAWIAAGLSAASAGASAWFFWSERRAVTFAAAPDDSGGAVVTFAWRFGGEP